ncbi:PspC domain-containing protein [Glutamicibacter sp. MNS18]|uniref:PspC domain-containing protein n=1 Tax=Glutamicibacter sp. MNS18 TaxID=2989817 RepID=UPI0022358EE9|nr:PspC domain-containing protein [Glutamicibacter sp. MNS18]MCW4464132.1 PspC domain-containing protein [Glutamicibacter sp. MNS18]
MDKFFNSLRSIPLRRGPARMAGGVAGGIADKFGWDLTIVRIAMLLSFLLPGVGIAAYVVAWLLIPAQDNSIILQKWLRAL